MSKPTGVTTHYQLWLSLSYAPWARTSNKLWSLFCVKNNEFKETCKQQWNMLTLVFNVKCCINFDAMWPAQFLMLLFGNFALAKFNVKLTANLDTNFQISVDIKLMQTQYMITSLYHHFANLYFQRCCVPLFWVLKVPFDFGSGVR